MTYALAFSLAHAGALAQAQEIPKEYQEALTILGKKGDYKDGVFKVGIPRSDLHVTVAGIETPTAFGFGGWLAMTKGDGGLDVVAIHHHMLDTHPPIIFLHYWGTGPAEKLAAGFAAALDAPRATDPTVTFDDAPTGKLPTGWLGGVTGEGSPKWSVETDESAPSKPNVLKQSGEGTYPWCVKKDVSIADGFVEVKFKPIAGKEDQAGGIVWRWKDGDNYYIARANALENNVVLYKVEKGKRKSLDIVGRKGGYGVEADVPKGQWSALRVEFAGSLFTVFLNGKQLFQAEDKTFTRPGKVGVWTKADSVTLFDDFSYGGK